MKASTSVESGMSMKDQDFIDLGNRTKPSTSTRASTSIIVTSASLLFVTLIAAACATSSNSMNTSGSKGGSAAATENSELSGSQLWGQTCGLCHNAPSPKDYSDSNWEVAVMHMRVQARLTGEEERKIVQFLKASN